MVRTIAMFSLLLSIAQVSLCAQAGGDNSVQEELSAEEQAELDGLELSEEDRKVIGEWTPEQIRRNLLAPSRIKTQADRSQAGDAAQPQNKIHKQGRTLWPGAMHVEPVQPAG